MFLTLKEQNTRILNAQSSKASSKFTVPHFSGNPCAKTSGKDGGEYARLPRKKDNIYPRKAWRATIKYGLSVSLIAG